MLLSNVCVIIFVCYTILVITHAWMPIVQCTRILAHTCNIGSNMQDACLSRFTGFPARPPCYTSSTSVPFLNNVLVRRPHTLSHSQEGAGGSALRQFVFIPKVFEVLCPKLLPTNGFSRHVFQVSRNSIKRKTPLHPSAKRGARMNP